MRVCAYPSWDDPQVFFSKIEDLLRYHLLSNRLNKFSRVLSLDNLQNQNFEKRTGILNISYDLKKIRINLKNESALLSYKPVDASISGRSVDPSSLVDVFDLAGCKIAEGIPKDMIRKDATLLKVVPHRLEIGVNPDWIDINIWRLKTEQDPLSEYEIEVEE